MTFWMKVCKFRANRYLRKLNKVYSNILWLDSMVNELGKEFCIDKQYELDDTKELMIIANKVMSYIELVGEKYEQLPKCDYKNIMRDCYCISCNNYDNMITLFTNTYKTTPINDIFYIQFKKYGDYLNGR